MIRPRDYARQDEADHPRRAIYPIKPTHAVLSVLPPPLVLLVNLVNHPNIVLPHLHRVLKYPIRRDEQMP